MKRSGLKLGWWTRRALKGLRGMLVLALSAELVLAPGVARLPSASAAESEGGSIDGGGLSESPMSFEGGFTAPLFSAPPPDQPVGPGQGPLGRGSRMALPTLTIVEPPNGSTVTSRLVNIGIAFGDQTSGIDPTTLRITINGIDRTKQFTFSGGGARLQVPILDPQAVPRDTADLSAREKERLQFSRATTTSRAQAERKQLFEKQIVIEGQNVIIATVKNRGGVPAVASSSFILDLRAAIPLPGPPRSAIEESYLLPASKVPSVPIQPDLSRDLAQFGYDQFSAQSATFALATDVAVGPDYILGPGDSMVLYMWGMVNNTIPVSVGQTGEIFLPKLGALPVWGLTFSETEALLRRQLARQFSGFQMSLTMGALRSIQVSVLGEVTRPGIYTLSPLATISNAVFAAGGPTKTGSLRQVKLMRNGQQVAILDAYEYLMKGDKARDLRLQSGDTVFVPPIGPVVGITGHVKRPAIYELRGATRLSDLIAMAGGPMPTAQLQRVQIERVHEFAQKVVVDYDVSRYYSKKDVSADPEVKDGDLVKIFPIDARIYNSVSLEGFVRQPGDYQLKPKMRLSDLLTPESVLPEAYVDRVEVVRTKPDFTREVLTADVQKLWQGDKGQDIELEKYDKVFVNSEFRGLQTVLVKGEVKRPGSYVISKGERLSAVLRRAGGFTDQAHVKGAIFTRESVKKAEREQLEQFVRTQEQRLVAESAALTAGAAEEAAAEVQALSQRREVLRLLASQVVLGRVVVHLDELEKIEGTINDIELQDGDVLTVPQPANSVLVLGSVRNPTAILYKPGETFQYYINQAGGFTKDAEVDDVHVIKANGSTQAGYMKLRTVEPGDVIVTPTTTEAKVKTRTLVKDVAQIMGSVALTIGGLAVFLK